MRFATTFCAVLPFAGLGCGETEPSPPGSQTIGGSSTDGGSGTGGMSRAGQAGSTDTGGQASGGIATSGTTSSGGGGNGNGGFPGLDLPEGKGWLELQQTELSPVCACNDGFPEVCANSGCGGIFAWSSGAYDSRRSQLIVFGGGHSDYFGNELYALSLNDVSMTRLTDPGLPLADECTWSTASGTQPASRHTYDTLLYLTHADRLFVFGGSMPPCGYLSQDTWTYSFADAKWELHEPTGPKPRAVPGIVADYDAMTQRVFLHDDAALYSYDLETDAFELLLENDSIDYHMTGVVDPVARKLVLVGAGDVFVYALDGDHTPTSLATTGADDLVASVYPGLAFEPASGKIVAWNGGDSAYSLDLGTGVWSALNSPAGPGPANETGTYKRWSYVGESSFALVNGPSQNAFLFRL